MPLPLTYSEPVWLSDLDPSGRETTSDLQNLEQDLLHILMETLGTNQADPAKGIGIVNYLNGTSDQLIAAGATIDHQLSLVTRLDGSNTTVSQQSDGSWSVYIEAKVQGQVIGFSYVLGPNGLNKAS